MNEVRRRGPIARFFVGLWDAMNFTRRLFYNLLFNFLLLLFLIVIGAAGRVAPLQAHTTLVLAPEGRLVEQYSSDALSRALSRAMGDKDNEEVQLRDLLRALDAAKDDASIERVLLRLDRLQPTGWASLRELGEAIADVRAAGKQVVAFGEGYMQGQ